jgi:hypothetical protein
LGRCRLRFNQFQQRRVTFFQTSQIDRFIIRCIGLPAFPDDADPFESQATDSGGVAFALSALAGVVGLGPGGIFDRFAREFDEGLAEELRTKVT